MGTKLSKSKRYAARQIIHSNAVCLLTLEHELWRVANVEAAGLTEKEQEFLKKRVQVLKKVSDDISKLGQRLQGTL